MTIAKYKLEQGPNGEGFIPSMIEDGGYWFSPINGTLLGWVKQNTGDRFVPSYQDNILKVTKTDVVVRALEIHAVVPYTKVNSDDITEVMTEAEVTIMMEQWFDNMYVEKTGVPYIPSNDEVNAERERRISLGCTVSISGVGSIFVTGNAEDIRNMAGLGQGALARIVLGDTTTLVPYRDGNNDVFNLTPPQMLELWQKSAGYVSAVYQASWVLKANTIPVDFKTNNTYWPSATI